MFNLQYIYLLDMNKYSYQILLQGRKRQKPDKAKLTSEKYSFFYGSFVCANGNTKDNYKLIFVEDYRKIIGFYHIKKS